MNVTCVVNSSTSVLNTGMFDGNIWSMTNILQWIFSNLNSVKIYIKVEVNTSEKVCNQNTYAFWLGYKIICTDFNIKKGWVLRLTDTEEGLQDWKTGGKWARKNTRFVKNKRDTYSYNTLFWSIPNVTFSLFAGANHQGRNNIHRIAFLYIFESFVFWLMCLFIFAKLSTCIFSVICWPR